MHNFYRQQQAPILMHHKPIKYSLSLFFYYYKDLKKKNVRLFRISKNFSKKKFEKKFSKKIFMK